MATGDGRPFFAAGFHAAGFFVPEFFGEEAPAEPTLPGGATDDLVAVMRRRKRQEVT